MPSKREGRDEGKQDNDKEGQGSEFEDCPSEISVNDTKSLLESDAAAILVDCREARECSICLLYTSPSPRDLSTSRMPSSA